MGVEFKPGGVYEDSDVKRNIPNRGKKIDLAIRQAELNPGKWICFSTHKTIGSASSTRRNYKDSLPAGFSSCTRGNAFLIRKDVASEDAATEAEPPKE